MTGPREIRLLGPGGAGKSTIGALLAARLEVTFVDLDRHLAGRVGDISEYIGGDGYDTKPPENSEADFLPFRAEIRPRGFALSFRVLTDAPHHQPEYSGLFLPR